MKKIIMTCLVAVTLSNLNAQTDSTKEQLQNFLSIPALKINTVPDSSFYSKDQLKPGSPVMIMFFSPDCDHCQQQTKELLANKNELKNIQVIMVSPLSYADNKKFYEDYGLASMPNIKVGTDATYKLLRIYKPTVFPAMYVYDKNGTLAKAFVGNIAVSAIVDAVK